MYSRWFLLILLSPFFLLLGMGLGLPLGDSVTNSLFGTETVGEAYADIAASNSFRNAMQRTFVVAFWVTFGSLLLGYPAAALITRAGPSAKALMLAMVLFPMMTNSIARVYGWVGVFQRNGLADQIASMFGAEPLRLLYTQTAVAIGMLHYILPIVILVLAAALERYDERLTRASRSLGAGFWRTFWTVKVPVLLPQILAAATLAFVFTLGFFITPAVLGGGQDLLISVVIEQQLGRLFNLPRVQAMSITLLITTLAVLALAAWGSSRLTATTERKAPDA